MLLKIDPLLSPPLLQTLMEMGHGDELVLADANYPAASHTSRLLYCSGHGMAATLGAILSLFPLDYAAKHSCILMQPTNPNADPPPVWADVRPLILAQKFGDKPFCYMEKGEFYQRSTNAYAIIQTGELAPFSNLILRKGVIPAG